MYANFSKKLPILAPNPHTYVCHITLLEDLNSSTPYLLANTPLIQYLSVFGLHAKQNVEMEVKNKHFW